MNSIEFVTDRLRLRPVIDEDAVPTSALMRDEIAANLTTWDPQTTITAALERIETSSRLFTKRQALDLAVLDRSSSSFLGWLSLFKDGERRGIARIGFWLGCDYQGQGLVVEAAQPAMPLGMKLLGVRELEACVYPWNTHCIRVMGKLRFESDGMTELYSSVRLRKETALLFRRDFGGSSERVGERHRAVDGRLTCD